MPKWCSSCNKYVSDLEPHEDDCAVALEPLARKARARQRGEVPFLGYLKLYGVFVCLAVVGYIIWRMLEP